MIWNILPYREAKYQTIFTFYGKYFFSLFDFREEEKSVRLLQRRFSYPLQRIASRPSAKASLQRPVCEGQFAKAGLRKAIFRKSV